MGCGGFCALESGNGAVALAMHQQRVNVDSILIVETTVEFSNADDLVACLGHQFGGVRAHIAESLDDHPCAFRQHAQLARGFVANDHQTASRCLAASARSSNVERLARHDSGHGLAHVHRVRIHDPRHSLLIRVHVRGGNIFFRTDEFDQLSRVAAGNLFQFGLRELLGIADYPALGSSERDVDDCAFPGHPTG